MKAATHQGTCQACGRTQAVTDGTIHKHGYTVDSGFFNGTCPAADHLPLQQADSQFQKHQERRMDYAKRQAAMTAVDFSELTFKLWSEGGELLGSYYKKNAPIESFTKKQYVNRKVIFNSHECAATWAADEFDKAVENKVRAAHRNGEMVMADHADMKKLHADIFGTKLIAIAPAKKWSKDCDNYKSAYAFATGQKALGHKAIIRRSSYGRGQTVHITEA